LIKVRLKGGLGNQMFQYAVGLSTAMKLETELILDATSFKSDEKRNYDLGQFNISKEKKVIHKMSYLRILSDKLIWKVFNEDYIKSNYDKNYLSIKDQTILDGYWQCDKYFSDIEDEIRSTFVVKPKKKIAFDRLVDKIDNPNSVSLHIRRGDYVEKSGQPSSHVLLGLDYYRRAVDIIKQKIPKIKLWVFSDEPDWVRANFKSETPFEVLSDLALFTSAEEMSLMSRCAHNIIANSTYSWWAAWLNNNKEKIVIAPKLWFLNDGGIDDKRLPTSWDRI